MREDGGFVAWLRQLPPRPRSVLVGVVGLVGCALGYVPVAALMVGVFDEPWWNGLPQYLSIAAAVGLVTWWRDRGHDLTEEERRRALRSGRPPADGDPEVWRRAVRQDLQVQAWAGRALGVVLPLALVLMAVVTVTADLGPVGWGITAAVVALMGVLWPVRRRNVRRLHVLLRQLPPVDHRSARVGQDGGVENSSAMPSGSRNGTPEP